MFSKSLFAAALAAIGISAFGVDIPAYDATYTEQGVTYAQRGGLGMKDFVVTNIVVNGQPRPLPPYLYLLELDDTYPDDAAWYYQNADYAGGGRCSVRRDGNAVERNYDWHFDDAATFVLKVSGEEGRRFASVSVANVGTNLTDRFVRSGAWSRFYKCLAGHSVDGVNENGVFAEVNVTSGSWGRTSGTVHGLGAVRWVLDHGTNAQQAADYIAANVYLPQGFGVNFHYLIADRSKTYIVENGEAHEVTNAPAVMTNFNLDSQGGEGYERYASLTNGATIQSQWWTKAYSPETRPIRFSDLGTNYESIWERWSDKPREAHRGEVSGGQTWWQTVHCSVYDLQKLTLRIAVQEVEDWYVFACPSSGKVKSVNGKVGEVVLTAEDVHALPETYTPPVQPTNTNEVEDIVRPMIGDATNGLRRVEDLVVYTNGFTAFKWTCDNAELRAALGDLQPQRTPVGTWSVVDIVPYPFIAADSFESEDATVLEFSFANMETGESVGSATATRTLAHVDSGDILATTNGVRAVETSLTAKIDEKRNKTDLDYENYGEWATEPDMAPIRVAWNGVGWALYEPSEKLFISSVKGLSTSTNLEWSSSESGVFEDVYAHRVHILDTIALVSQLPSAAQLLTAEQRAEIAKVKDKADEFTEWVPDEDAPSDLVGQPELQVFSPTTVWLQWHTERGIDYNSDPLTPEFEDTEVTFRGDGVLGSFTATRKRVLRTGDAATPQELTNAISTNNPAFVSAVRDTPAPEPGQGEDPPWGTWGTVGAAIAGLVAALKMTVKKIKCGTMPEITPTNGVADVSDFFAESNSLLTGVIDARLPYPLYAVPTATGLLKDRALNTTSLASVTVPDNFTDLLIRASVASSLPVTMPTAITTKYGDTFPDAEGEYLITITKTGAAEAYVRVIKLEVANA